MGERLDGGGGVAGAGGRLLVQCGAVARPGEGRHGRSGPADGEQGGDEDAARAAYREDRDKGGQTDDGEGRGHSGDITPVGRQRQDSAADRGIAAGPGLPGSEQDDGSADCAEQQSGGKTAAAARGGCGRSCFGSGLGYGTHVLHYPLRPEAPVRRLAEPTARSTAAALLRHSLSSETGSESATTPAPAWT